MHNNFQRRARQALDRKRFKTRLTTVRGVNLGREREHRKLRRAPGRWAYDAGYSAPVEVPQPVSFFFSGVPAGAVRWPPGSGRRISRGRICGAGRQLAASLGIVHLFGLGDHVQTRGRDDERHENALRFHHHESGLDISLIAEQGDGALEFGVVGHARKDFRGLGKMNIAESKSHQLTGLQTCVVHGIRL